MKNLINNRFLILLLGIFVIWNVNILAQNVIIENTNIPQLIHMEQIFREKFETNKQRAVEAAIQNGWIIREEFPDGKIIEIQGLSPNGMPIYYETHNLDAAKTISTDKVWSDVPAGLSLSGFGMTIGEWDGGAVSNTHQELIGRVTQKDAPTYISGHSTHVAGTLIAFGVEPLAKGMAYQANLHAYDWEFDNSEMSTAAAGELLISNHSYGFIRGWYYGRIYVNYEGWYWFGDISVSQTEDYRFGFYDSSTHDWDQIAYNAPYYLIVQSAGNDRNDTGPGPDGEHIIWIDDVATLSTTTRDPDGGSDKYDCIDQQGVAKNILTVGAVNDIPSGYSELSDVVMTTFSSWGPTDDGRIKPDIVGNGVNLYSSYPHQNNKKYEIYSGTSMSSPNVAGSLLLLQQHYKNLHYGNPMRAATLKALVIHTADEAGPADGPDYMFGWGLMNTASAASVISQDGTTASIMEMTLTDSGSYTFDVPATGGTPLVVTICWTDPSGTPIAPALNNRTTKMLVNDLDVRITEGVNNTYYPWILDPYNPADDASNDDTDNNTDNVEQIYIDNPTPGTLYTVEVTHKGSLENGVQNVSVIVSGINMMIETIADASAMGLINLYCYTYDGTHNQYVPIRATDDDYISPWTGFWVAVYQNVDLLIPELIEQGLAPSPANLLLNDNKWYLISAPLDTGADKDVRNNFSDSGELVYGEYGTNWRVYKWQYDSKLYHYYGQPGVTFEELIPGRGFMIKHKYSVDKSISIEGSGVDPSGDPGNYELKLPANVSGETFHMVGNPYWYNIKWKDCKVRVPMNPGLPLGKVAVSAPDEVDEWYIRLKLESLDGTALDTYNRAGVVKTAGINPAYYRAYDIEPMAPYVRLWLQDPSEPECTPLAYDYRASGLDEYTWEVMLTTTYPQIEARLSLVDLAHVPDQFSITLQDTDTGETHEMSSDNSFEVSLLEESPKMFVLTAARIQENSGDPIVVEEAQPAAFGIIDIRPNPFNPATILNYGLDRAGNVKVRIYNLNGQLMETLIDTHMSAGHHSIVWNAEGHASGVYVVLVESGGLIDYRKITLIK